MEPLLIIWSCKHFDIELVFKYIEMLVKISEVNLKFLMLFLKVIPLHV
jgi:hypothetical protein